jgi:hypothetical protein
MDEEFPVHQPDGSKSPVYSKESIDHDANKLNEESTKNLE